jgi:hypothetical protein
MSGGVGGEIALITNSADATGSSIQVPRYNHAHESHLRTILAWGTWDTANLAIQISADGTNWIPISNADTITADTAVNIEFRAPYVRAVITGSGGSTSVTAKMI